MIITYNLRKMFYSLGYFSVAFDATVSNYPNMQKNDPVKFDNVRLNDGNG